MTDSSDRTSLLFSFRLADEAAVSTAVSVPSAATSGLFSSWSSKVLLLVLAKSLALADAEKEGKANKLTNKVVLNTAVPLLYTALD